jgi:small GTP-binding protein
MTTNVSLEFGVAKDKYDNAKTPQEKLAALLEMKSTGPKHKGGEALMSEINTKIAKLKAEMEKEKAVAAKRSGGNTLSVKKEGPAQLVLVGLPNSGKTTFFNSITGLKGVVGDYEFTTTVPDVGMMDYKHAKIQIVDLPPLVEGSSEGKFNGAQILAVIRNADALVLVVNSNAPLSQYATLKKELNAAGILIGKHKPQIKIVNSTFPGISIAGKQFLKIKEEELVEYLKGNGMYNAQVILREPLDFNVLAQVLDESIVYKRMAIVFTHGKPKELFPLGADVPQIIAGETIAKEDIEKVKDQLFSVLDKVYVYTKKPGDPPALHQPLIVDAGSTVADVARDVHKELAANLKYAKIWGSAKFDGQRVALDYEVKNGDVVEFGW